MPFSQDRDLLAACPTLLSDVTWGSQTPYVLTGGASLTDGVLTLSSITLAEAGVESGSVMLINNTPREVVAMLTATSCETSLIRGSIDDASMPGVNAGSPMVTFRNFAPQRESACKDILRDLGVDLDAGNAQDTIDSIVNPQILSRLEVFKTLEDIYSLATGTDEQNLVWRHHASYYRGRFAEVFAHAKVAFDFDGDGVVDQERKLHVLPTARV